MHASVFHRRKRGDRSNRVRGVPDAGARTVEKYGGKFLVRGGQMLTLEGHWKPKRLVVTEFPTIEQARRWYDSEEYRALKALRLRTARGSVVLVEGV